MSTSSAQPLLDRLAPLIDERCGIISQVVPMAFPPEIQGVTYGFSAPLGRPNALHPVGCAISDHLGALVGHGTAVDESTARIRAVCEALERYCAVMHPVSGVIHATAGALGSEAMDLTRFPRCSAREIARSEMARNVHVDVPLHWVRGYSLTERSPRWVPLTAVYLSLPIPLQEHVTFPTSTGFAAGANFEQATVSALLEVIERDSLALWWLHQLRSPRLLPSTFASPAVTKLVERYSDAGIVSHLLDLTTDVCVPVIGVVQVSEGHAPHVVTMGASRPTAAAAALRVLEEAASLRVALTRPGLSRRREDFDDGVAMGPEDFGLLYAGPEAIARFAFATEASPVSAEVPAPLGGRHLATIVARLRKLDMEVVVVDVTLPEVRERGLVVVKVIVPGLMPLTFSHALRYLGHPRLYRAPTALGYEPRDEGAITDDPIPFA